MHRYLEGVRVIGAGWVGWSKVGRGVWSLR